MRRRVLQALAGLMGVVLSGCGFQPPEEATGARNTTGQQLVASWSGTGSLINSDGFAGQTATVLPSGKVLVVGGYKSPGDEAAAELYDPVTGTWSSAGMLNDARTEHTATLLSNGKVVVAGGHHSTGLLASVEVYDPGTNLWSSTGDMQLARSKHGAVEVITPAGPRLLVMGGFDSPSWEQDTAELFDLATGSWTFAASMNTARSGFRAVKLSSGKVLVMGGNSFYSIIDSAEEYDPSTDTWSPVGSLMENRRGYTATLLSSGKVLVTGGLHDTNGSGFVDLASAELYDPATSSWSSAGSMPYDTSVGGNGGRGSHAAALLATGEVLVVGGVGGSVMQSAVVYDPTANTWSATADTLDGRAFHTLSVLPSGEVLAVGGQYARTSSELYTP
ncbi:kelch repeat-containing protein [Stigmatella sp. ncwal1]|uniref:Kelch repeat-containing protein n=1 Tax=Stigmatella ashevillensis TaxID=2995309 RepID=A0ABT5DMA6_9BACT|nr:kelch repeat-containing protein [Stigmatella ashevillena]MDC0714794.1 kelch repeat-containing protein [Stigmatella ashevillena]